jgi:5-methylthioadenosine/S-adenosylhomocysteine deaminase
MATIIKGAYLMTEDGLKKDWGVKVEGNAILAVGPNSTLNAEAGDKVLDATDRLVAPGFVNGHVHMYNVFSRGITTDALVTEFSSFLEDFWWPYIEDRIHHEQVEITTKWACVELIKSGTTSFLDVLEGPNSVPGALEIEKGIIEKAGLRARLCFEACQRVSEENAQIGLKENADFVRNNNKPGNLVQGLMSIHTLFTGDKDFVKQAAAMAKELDCDIHMHLSESVYEPNWTLDKYGKRPVEIYEELGYLAPNVVASQGVKLTDSELDTVAKRGARLVHMPLSNCEVGGGFAPVPGMLERGIKVGLGSDGFINSFFEVMRGAWLVHKAHHEDPQIMPAKDVYNMATALGAEAIGINNTGKLKEGYLADIITIKIDTPTPVNEHNVYDQLVLFRNPSDVVDVMIDGKFVMEDGKLLTLDEEAIKAELREASVKFWKGD